MKSPYLILGLFAVLFTAPTASIQRDGPAISALRLALDAAVNARDAEGVSALFTSDAVYLEPAEREVTGRGALKSLLQKAYGQSSSAPKVRRTAQEVQFAGDWAFEWGRVEAIRPFVGGPSTWIDGKYLHVYQRQIEGGWRIARASYTPSPPEKTQLASK
jgi:uncharacterized protein (TIGR02246 family)